MYTIIVYYLKYFFMILESKYLQKHTTLQSWYVAKIIILSSIVKVFWVSFILLLKVINKKTISVLENKIAMIFILLCYLFIYALLHTIYLKILCHRWPTLHWRESLLQVVWYFVHNYYKVFHNIINWCRIIGYRAVIVSYCKRYV